MFFGAVGYGMASGQGIVFDVGIPLDTDFLSCVASAGNEGVREKDIYAIRELYVFSSGVVGTPEVFLAVDAFDDIEFLAVCILGRGVVACQATVCGAAHAQFAGTAGTFNTRNAVQCAAHAECAAGRFGNQAVCSWIAAGRTGGNVRDGSAVHRRGTHADHAAGRFDVLNTVHRRGTHA